MAQLTAMAFDFSQIDAELDALGQGQAQADELARREANALGPLEEVDAALDALGVAAPLNFADSRISLPRRTDPKSGEISLGEPVRRSTHPASGELALDGEAPTSGSFELDEPQPIAETVSASDLETDAEVLTLSLAPNEKAVAAAPEADVPLALFPENDGVPEDDVFPASDGELASESAPVLLTTEKKRESLRPEPTTDPFAGLVDEPRENEVGLFSERDPDAEFDALFDEATSPSGVPTRGLDEDGASPDALLQGLKAPPVPGPSFPAVGQNEADAAMSELFEMEEGDATEILDARSVFAEQSASSDPFPLEEELGSSEFEIVLDETGEAKDLVPSDRPGKMPSQAPASAGEKRPSFLGRLFGKKED